MPRLLYLMLLVLSGCPAFSATVTECRSKVARLNVRPVILHPSPYVQVLSLIHRNKDLQAYAAEAGRNEIVQKALDKMLEVETAGGADLTAASGKNRAALGNGFYEIKNASGARLYIRRVKNDDGSTTIFVVGKSDKNNQGKVFSAMRKTFPGFPEPPPGMGERR